MARRLMENAVKVEFVEKDPLLPPRGTTMERDGQESPSVMRVEFAVGQNVDRLAWVVLREAQDDVREWDNECETRLAHV